MLLSGSWLLQSNLLDQVVTRDFSQGEYSRQPSNHCHSSWKKMKAVVRYSTLDQWTSMLWSSFRIWSLKHDMFFWWMLKLWICVLWTHNGSAEALLQKACLFYCLVGFCSILHAYRAKWPTMAVCTSTHCTTPGLTSSHPGVLLVQLLWNIALLMYCSCLIKFIRSALLKSL